MKSERQAARWREFYRLMLVIRLFEEKVEALFTKGLIRGTAHPAIGQEAIAVGACSVLRRNDYVTSTHRGHGHCVARGGDPSKIMAELFGKVTGYSRGRGGSQLMMDLKKGFLGSNGITGGGIPLATGVALSAKLRKTGQVVLCFFGDGASNQGTFHESLNMAAIWKLPVVYLCENNRYAMSMPVTKSVAVADIAARAAGYGFPGVVVDGNDLHAVRAAVRAACRRARGTEGGTEGEGEGEGKGPTLIECKTYRLSGHSRGDLRRYRTAGEEQEWRARDPIRRFRRWLREHDFMDAEQDRQALRSARATVNQSVAFSRKSPEPDPATVGEGVWA